MNDMVCCHNISDISMQFSKLSSAAPSMQQTTTVTTKLNHFLRGWLSQVIPQTKAPSIKGLEALKLNSKYYQFIQQVHFQFNLDTKSMLFFHYWFDQFNHLGLERVLWELCGIFQQTRALFLQSNNSHECLFLAFIGDKLDCFHNFLENQTQFRFFVGEFWLQFCDFGDIFQLQCLQHNISILLMLFGYNLIASDCPFGRLAYFFVHFAFKFKPLNLLLMEIDNLFQLLVNLFQLAYYIAKAFTFFALLILLIGLLSHLCKRVRQLFQSFIFIFEMERCSSDSFPYFSLDIC